MNMENISVLKKRVKFCTPKISVLIEKGVFFSLKIHSQMQGPGSMYFVRKNRGDPVDKII